GATDTFAQASVLDLYDPDRSKRFVQKGQASDRASFESYIISRVRADAKTSGGTGLAFLVEENNSPTRERLRAEIQKQFPRARWCVYEPLGNDAFRESVAGAFGPNVRIRPKLDLADVIVAL